MVETDHVDTVDEAIMRLGHYYDDSDGHYHRQDIAKLMGKLVRLKEYLILKELNR